jgi:hypothetical protein
LRKNRRTMLILTLYRDRATCVFKGDSQTKPPVPTGKRVSYGLSRKQVTRVRRGLDYIGSRGPLFMYTLTFPNPEAVSLGNEVVQHAISHKEAAARLSNWLKRVKYAYGKEVEYVWVAEIQPRRLAKHNVSAIHYHLVCNVSLSIDFLHTSWSGVNGGTAVAHKRRGVPASYLTKYVSKGQGPVDATQAIEGNRCGLSQSVTAALKAVQVALLPDTDSETAANTIYAPFDSTFQHWHPGYSLWHWGHKSPYYLE